MESLLHFKENTTMTIETLFGKEEVNGKPRTIKLRQIKAIYETLTVSEDITDYLKTGNPLHNTEPGIRYVPVPDEGNERDVYYAAPGR
jgi:hypothetical protein